MKKSEVGGTCSTCEEEERHVQGLVGKTEGKKPLGRPRCRWEDFIKIYLQEVGWRGAWIGLIWLRIWTVWGHCECGNKSPGSIKCGEFFDWLQNCLLSRRTEGVSELVTVF